MEVMTQGDSLKLIDKRWKPCSLTSTQICLDINDRLQDDSLTMCSLLQVKLKNPIVLTFSTQRSLRKPKEERLSCPCKYSVKRMRSDLGACVGVLAPKQRILI